ncbi:hypothetical protein GC092_00510 [Microbacterium sp. JZ37]|nr:hypothetical protein GC092_00510 [Microbacterium sp. JZ37]
MHGEGARIRTSLPGRGGPGRADATGRPGRERARGDGRGPDRARGGGRAPRAHARCAAHPGRGRDRCPLPPR